MQWQRGDIVITDDRTAVDPVTVHQLLQNSYWATARSLDTILTTIERSLCFTVLKDGRQVGFARVVTDYTTFAWIADVIVAPEVRGQGIGKFLVQCITDHPALAATTQTLRTRDAHGLYEQFGFRRTEFMVRKRL